ncbi:hypothetical protein H2248_003400 [Termitomyces sp. 'cryptogamus']|nr:hypothetical protein H2248_003400 [Termitomyces sp. 'cryptogamus']
MFDVFPCSKRSRPHADSERGKRSRLCAWIVSLRNLPLPTQTKAAEYEDFTQRISSFATPNALTNYKDEDILSFAPPSITLFPAP